MLSKKELKEIALKAVAAVCPSLVTEGYSRVKSKIEHKGTPFILISAFRDGRTNAHNLEMDKQMRTLISTTGYPFVDNMAGGYLEDPEDGEGPKVPVEEKSVLIYGDVRGDYEGDERASLKDLGEVIAQTFEQDSFILGEPMVDQNGKVVFDQNGNVMMDIRAYSAHGAAIEEPWAGPWNTLAMANNDDVYWSTIYGKRSKLVEINEQYTHFKPRSMMDAMKKDFYLKASKSALDFLGE